MFAVRNIHIRFANLIKQSFFTYHKGIVLNSFYRKVDCVFRDLEGYTLILLIINYFSNAKHEKQFTIRMPGMWCCNVQLTKRGNFTYITLQNFQRLWQQMVCYIHKQERLCCKVPSFQKAIHFSKRQNTSRGHAFTFTEIN